MRQTRTCGLGTSLFFCRLLRNCTGHRPGSERVACRRTTRVTLLSALSDLPSGPKASAALNARCVFGCCVGSGAPYKHAAALTRERERRALRVVESRVPQEREAARSKTFPQFLRFKKGACRPRARACSSRPWRKRVDLAVPFARSVAPIMSGTCAHVSKSLCGLKDPTSSISQRLR